MPTTPARKIIGNRLLAAALILLGLAALTPGAISYGIRHWLAQQGLENSYLLDVSFNPFAGRLTLAQLKGSKVDTPPLSLRTAEVNIDWWPLTRRQASIQAIVLEGLELTLIQRGDNLSISGIPLVKGNKPRSAEDSTPSWGFGLDLLEIRDARIGFDLPDFKQTLVLDNVTLKNLHSWEADRPARLDLKLHLGDATITLDLDVRSFSATRTIDGQVQIQGLDLAKLAADLRSALPAELSVTGAQLDMDATIELKLEDHRTQFAQTGRVLLRGNNIRHSDYQLRAERVLWEGTTSWNKTDGPMIKGRLTARGLNASAPDHALLLARVDALEVSGLKFDRAQQLQLAQLTLAQPAFLASLDEQPKAATPLFRATELKLGTSHIQPERTIALGPLSAQGVQLVLHRNAQGQLQPLDRLPPTRAAADPAGQAEQPPASDDPPTRLALSLDGLQLLGNTKISFKDAGTQPPFAQTLVLEQLVLGRIDSQSNQPTPFALKGSIGEFSQIALEGEAQPLAEKRNLLLKGDIKAMELPPLSSYTASALGYNLRSGQLDATLDIKIVEDQLDTVTKLTLNKLTVKPADPTKFGQMTRELAMPLDTALNMMRDSDDNIRLKLPITGDIHAPDFDLSHVINKAIGKALKTAAISSIKLALQPYGTLLTLVQAADKRSQQALLKPIEFQPNRTILSAENLDYLGKLSQLLTDRPKMTVKVCGMATDADRQVRISLAEATRQQELEKQAKRKATTAQPQPLPPITIPDEQLLTLAKDRADIVKRQLVNMGTAAERLFVCNPELDTDAKAQPRADLML